MWAQRRFLFWGRDGILILIFLSYVVKSTKVLYIVFRELLNGVSG